MTRLQRDFLGPFVECNGSINRPPSATALNLGGPIVATHIRYTPKVRVRDDAGAEEQWHSCGEASAYHEARKTLPRAEFEQFAAMACGPEFAYNGAARELYPQMAKLIPQGRVDYLGPERRAHTALSEKLSKAASDRRNAAYLAKHGGKLPAPTGPAPVQLKAVRMDDVLKSMGATVDYRYLQLPEGNRGEFLQLDSEMARRGVRVEFSDLHLKSGETNGRVYRVRADDLELLPKDEKGPYFGDDNAGFALSTLGAPAFESTRKEFRGGPWTAIAATEPMVDRMKVSNPEPIGQKPAAKRRAKP